MFYIECIDVTSQQLFVRLLTGCCYTLRSTQLANILSSLMLRSKICALFFLLPSARFKSYIPFVSSSLSFQLFPAVCSVLPSDLILPVSSQLFLSVRCVLSFISSLLFHLLLPFFRINSYVLFVSFFLPFQLFLSIRCVCA